MKDNQPPTTRQLASRLRALVEYVPYELVQEYDESRLRCRYCASTRERNTLDIVHGPACPWDSARKLLAMFDAAHAGEDGQR